MTLKRIATALICGVFVIALASSQPVVAVGDVVCEGDVDGDGQVGILDIIEVIIGWGACPDPPDECPGDVDGDGEVGIEDLLVVITNFGPCEGKGCDSDAACDDGDDCTVDICILGVCHNFPHPDCG